VIEGLKLTMTGAALRSNLDERIRWYQGQIRSYTKESPSMAHAEQALVSPRIAIEGEIARAERRIETLTLIRDYVIPDEVYRLTEGDLQFADLLPEPDPWDCGCVPYRVGEGWGRVDPPAADTPS
jgi:hypothetical protein